jgi:hypothetical protein
MMLGKPTGARFEISIDGKPRSYRDSKPVALEAAEYFKCRYPNSEVAVKNLQSGELTPAIPSWVGNEKAPATVRATASTGNLQCTATRQSLRCD